MSVTDERGGTTVDIDADVELLAEQIKALKELGSKGQVSEGERYDFSVRWGTLQVGRLRRLVHYSSLGMLSDADERRFHALCAELRSLSGLIDRFRLAQPVFDEKARAGAHRRRVPRQTKLAPESFSLRKPLSGDKIALG
ncbi:MAG: hypothetical protein QOH91_2647 [Mycobacterium sp.]|jgi:hypothetical protein|nr:hypothetical protein [Mycobacterium sp.]